MESERAQTTAGDNAGSVKRPYRKPELRELGTVRDLTLSGGTVKLTETSFPFAHAKTGS